MPTAKLRRIQQPGRQFNVPTPANIIALLKDMRSDYSAQTGYHQKYIDLYMLYCMFSGLVIFIYCLAVSSFPFNSFLAAFGSCVGSFVLAASLRTSLDDGTTPPGKGYMELLFAQLILQLAVVNFLG
ncbi:hypothetical protein ACOME3_004421 [Neoechinorhynchus agilis]